MLIALHSRGRQAGKDTAANYIGEWCMETGHSWIRHALAFRMKMLVALSLGLEGASEIMEQEVDRLKLEGHVGYSIGDKVYPTIDGRDFIINLAEGARALWGQNFWLDQVLPSTTDHRGICVVITDLRFVEEAIRVHRLSGLVVEVVNPRAEAPGGRSEQGLPPEHIDRVLDNTGDLAALKRNVHNLCRAVIPPR